MKSRWCAVQFVSAAFGLALAAFLLAGTPAQAATQASLAFEPQGGYEQTVQALALREITNGVADPAFLPTDLVTRAQMAVYLARALQLPECRYGDFVDVDRGDWGFSETTAVHRARLMDGTSMLTFSPNQPVSRQQAAALMVAALRYSVNELGAEIPDPLTPYRANDWLAGVKDRALIGTEYASSVAIAYRLGLFDVSADGWLLPMSNLTHEELAAMLQRTFLQRISPKTAYPVAVEATTGYPNLARSSKGPFVLILETRLAALNYPCGPVDGTYDARTRDAVYAFEKYERMKRTGKVTADVWQRLFASQGPQPVLNKPGRRIEVDLTRQVLMMIVDNKVIMTIHVSTGKTGTPTGTWHIRTRAKGWRPTSLGPIWSPCYFMARNAIHGYPSVPLYPASHGCVRTPIWVQNSLVDQIVMDMPVDVFYNKAR
jgi:N-acetylmuramoyl-L-alanine amidase